MCSMTGATRTLLLSATPYRMHTTDLERAGGQDDHYRDLLRTVRFLAGPAEAAALATELHHLRTALTNIPAGGTAPAIAAAESVSRRLRMVMVRTERLAATPDRYGMLATVTSSVPPPPADDIRSYLAAAGVIAKVANAGAGNGGHDLVELWKSVPYLLSFLNQENYTAKKALKDALADPVLGPEISTQLPGNPATLPWSTIESYDGIDPGNVRLRHLLGDATTQTYGACCGCPPAPLLPRWWPRSSR